MDTLLSPKTIGGYTFPNRIVMPALVRFTLNGRDGFVTERSIEHYWDITASTGLAVVEATAVAEDGKLHANMLGLWCDEQIEGMRRLAGAIHSNGAVAMLQLCFAGLASRDPSMSALGPSPEYFGRARLARAATVEEIAELEEMFVRAALRALEAGFDGVELHAAHSYLYCRFLDPVCNRRTDRYAGNNVEGRTRIVTETLEAIRRAVGNRMLLSVRLGCNAPDFATAQENFLKIAEAPVDLLHLSYGAIMPDPDPSIPKDFPCNTVVYHGARLARQVSLPVILSNEICTPEQAQYLIQNGFCDFAAIGRGMLADPHWAQKAANGEGDRIDPCYHCEECLWRVDEKRCPAALRRARNQG